MGATDGSESPSACWELNLGPLQEQPMLLTVEKSLVSNLKTKQNTFVYLIYVLACHSAYTEVRGQMDSVLSYHVSSDD